MFVDAITLSANVCFNVCLLGLQRNSAGGNFDLFGTLVVSSPLDSMQKPVKTHNNGKSMMLFFYFLKVVLTGNV